MFYRFTATKITGLNFIGDFVIVHAAAFRRWPFPVAEPLAEVPAEPAAKPHATDLRA